MSWFLSLLEYEKATFRGVDIFISFRRLEPLISLAELQHNLAQCLLSDGINIQHQVCSENFLYCNGDLTNVKIVEGWVDAINICNGYVNETVSLNQTKFEEFAVIKFRSRCSCCIY